MRLILQYVMLMLTLTLGAATAFHAQADDTDWQVWKVGGVEYVEVEDACKFYKYLPKQGRPGFKSYGSAQHTISVKANKQDFYVNNYRYILSYPSRSTTASC